MSTRIVHDNRLLNCCLSRSSAAVDKGAQFILVILNNTIGGYLHGLWRQAVYRVCADGGTNRLYDALTSDQRDSYIPELVIGDLDSARPDVVSFYRRKGSEIVKVDDQDTTDMTKALLHVQTKIKEGSLPAVPVVVYGAFGGRFDQVMGTMSSVLQFSPLLNRCLLVSEGNIAEALLPGSHTIKCYKELQGLGSCSCGLIPLGAPVKSITTTGLKWNLNGGRLAMGDFISTSNKTASELITVETSDPVLWTMSFELLEGRACTASTTDSKSPYLQ